MSWNGVTWVTGASIVALLTYFISSVESDTHRLGCNIFVAHEQRNTSRLWRRDHRWGAVLTDQLLSGGFEVWMLPVQVSCEWISAPRAFLKSSRWVWQVNCPTCRRSCCPCRRWSVQRSLKLTVLATSTARLTLPPRCSYVRVRWCLQAGWELKRCQEYGSARSCKIVSW